MLSPPPKIKASLLAKYPGLDQGIVFHVRRGDKVQNSSLGYVVVNSTCREGQKGGC